MRLVLLGPPGAGQGHAGRPTRRQIRHSAIVDRRHAARGGGRRHAAWRAGEGNHEPRRVGSGPVGDRSDRPAHRRAGMRARFHSGRLSAHHRAGARARRAAGRKANESRRGDRTRRRRGRAARQGRKPQPRDVEGRRRRSRRRQSGQPENQAEGLSRSDGAGLGLLRRAGRVEAGGRNGVHRRSHRRDRRSRRRRA